MVIRDYLCFFLFFSLQCLSNCQMNRPSGDFWRPEVKVSCFPSSRLSLSHSWFHCKNNVQRDFSWSCIIAVPSSVSYISLTITFVFVTCVLNSYVPNSPFASGIEIWMWRRRSLVLKVTFIRSFWNEDFERPIDFVPSAKRVFAIETTLCVRCQPLKLFTRALGRFDSNQFEKTKNNLKSSSNLLHPFFLFLFYFVTFR